MAENPIRQIATIPICCIVCDSGSTFASAASFLLVGSSPLHRPPSYVLVSSYCKQSTLLARTQTVALASSRRLALTHTRAHPLTVSHTSPIFRMYPCLAIARSAFMCTVPTSTTTTTRAQQPPASIYRACVYWKKKSFLFRLNHTRVVYVR